MDNEMDSNSGGDRGATVVTAKAEDEKIMKLTEKGLWMCKRPDGTHYHKMIP